MKIIDAILSEKHFATVEGCGNKLFLVNIVIYKDENDKQKMEVILNRDDMAFNIPMGNKIRIDDLDPNGIAYSTDRDNREVKYEIFKATPKSMVGALKTVFSKLFDFE